MTYLNDAGHGGTDPGAVANGQREKDWTLEASNYVNQALNKLGIKSSRVRTKDVTLNSNSRSKIVRDSGADYCLSHHYNAGGGRGAEFIHSIYSNGALEKILEKNFIAAGMPVRRTFTRKLKNGQDYYYMHRQTGSVRTTIIEYGFLDNKTDYNFLKIRSNRYKLYEAVIKSVCQYERVTYKDKKQRDGVVNDSNDSNNVAYYTVKRGDSLSKIASKYNTTVAKLVKDNNIKNKNLITVGQKIMIR